MSKSCNLAEALQKKNTRVVCPGLPDETYEFAQYVADHIDDRSASNPEMFGFTLFSAVGDIRRNHCGFGVGAKVIPEYIQTHREMVLKNACYILQILDVVTNRLFATAVRHSIKVCDMGWTTVPIWRPLVQRAE